MAVNNNSKPELKATPANILTALAIGVIAVDMDMRITYLNHAGAQIAGIEPEHALGKTCCDVFKSSLCDGECPLGAAFQTKEDQYNRDAVFIRQGGRSVVPVKISASPMLDGEGGLSGGVMTVQGHGLGTLMDHDRDYDWQDFIGKSPQVKRIFEVLKVVAPSDATILIEGPTGTGKDLLSNIIHQHSPRAKRPLIKVNCAALPENLLESEMFGYVRGAFTGADRNKPGRFQLADGGTIFLDEISEMPLSLQAKLLRILEDQEFYPLGAHTTTKVDVRVLAACNKPLAQQVKLGQFREDLFYRLNVIRVYIPPIKERQQDLPDLIRSFIQRKNVERGTYICKLSQHALDLLLNYEYPGNVRELENILEHACLLCQGDIIKESHLPWGLKEEPAHPPGAGEASAPEKKAPTVERDRLIAALEQCGWKRAQAAKRLDMDRTTLWRKMKRLGIETPS
jgi:PAS domain S-box-containing protein